MFDDAQFHVTIARDSNIPPSSSLLHSTSNLVNKIAKMPPFRPFPSPSLSVGTDICHIPRVLRLVNNPELFPRFLNRIFTKPERAAFQTRFSELLKQESGPVDDAGSKEKLFVRQGIAAHLAGRWAAKEAVIKACTWRRLLLSDVRIAKHEHNHSIYGVILDQVKAARDEEDALDFSKEVEVGMVAAEEDARPGQTVKVSISHDGDYATAVCLAAEEPAQGDVGGEAAARGML